VETIEKKGKKKRVGGGVGVGLSGEKKISVTCIVEGDARKSHPWGLFEKKKRPFLKTGGTSTPKVR